MRSDTVVWVAQTVTRNYMNEHTKMMKDKFEHIQVSFDYTDKGKENEAGKHFYNTAVEKQEKGACVCACVRARVCLCVW